MFYDPEWVQTSEMTLPMTEIGAHKIYSRSN